MEVALCTSKVDEASKLTTGSISPNSSNSNLYRDTLAAFSSDVSLSTVKSSSSSYSPESSTACCTTATTTTTSLSMTTSIVTPQAHSTVVTSLQPRPQILQPDNIDLDSSTTMSPDPSPSALALGSSETSNLSSHLSEMANTIRSETVTSLSSSAIYPNALPAATNKSSEPSPEPNPSIAPLATVHTPSESLQDEPIDIVDLSNDGSSTPPVTRTCGSSWPVSSLGVSDSACGSCQVISTSSISSKISIGEKSTMSQVSIPSTTTSFSSSLVMEAPVSRSSTNSPTTLSNVLLSAHNCNQNKTGGLVSKQLSTSFFPADLGLTQSVSSNVIHSPSPCMPTTVSTASTLTTTALLPACTAGLTPFRPPGSTDLATISSAPRLPMPSTPTPLPPYFPFTLTPISTNGDFPAVHFSLPGFPMVILQVLPLPGARMGEHYTINVPTQLILNGVASAIANGGTVNGGPIVLSIAPSGTLPPGVVPPAGACLPPTSIQPVTTALPDQNMLNAPTDTLGISTSGTTGIPVGVLNQSCSMPCSATNFSSPIMSSSTSTVIHNSLTNVQFPGFVLSPTSSQTNNNTTGSNSTSKRMRAIAPKPCQKLITAAPSTTAVSSRVSTTTISRGNAKRQNNVASMVIVSCAAPMPIVSTVAGTVTSGVGGTQAISCSKPSQTKRISIMPAGTTPSAARHGRGRRKTTVNNLTSLISPMALTNGLSSSSTQSLVTNTNNEPCMTTCNSMQPLPAPSQMQQPNPVQSMFTNQPLLVSNPNAPPILTGSMMPTGQIPQTFLFGGTMPNFSPAGATNGTSTSASGASPYLFQQPLPLPNGCSQFPVSMYNAVSCATSMPLSTTGPVTMVRSLQTASSASLFPSGAPTALATVDPSSGMITHFPNPCMPMAVPYSSNNSVSTDPNSFAALPTMMYSQPGLLLPNVSQQGSMVYPVPGQSLLTNPGPITSALPHTVTSTASMICPNQPGLTQPFSTAFMPNCSSGTLLSNSTLPNSLQVPSTFAPMLTEQQTFLPSLTGFDPMQSQHHSLLAPCTTIANNNQHDALTHDVMNSSACAVASSLNTITVNLDEDSNNGAAKDDLITLAWQLTQLKSSEMNTSLVDDGCQQQQESLAGLMDSAGNSNGSGGGGMLDALFDNYTDDRGAYTTYSTDQLNCGVVLSQVDNTELGAIPSASLTEETDEIVLLDGKSSPYDGMAPPNTELQLESDMYGNTTEESTGNADIDALLAAAAMVGAASGVGDAQSAVTVAVPCSSALTVTQQVDHREHQTVTICHSSTTSRDTTVLSVSGPVTVCTTSVTDDSFQLTRQSSSGCVSPKVINTTPATEAGGTSPVMTSCAPVSMRLNSPKDADDILPADFFTEFSDQDHDELGHFTEADEPTSLADVLGCNAEDAADLESVLGPEAHQLGGADHVSDSFLHSLVSDSPGLGLDAADEDDDVGEVAHHLFDSDFAVCVSEQLNEASAPTSTEKHGTVLPTGQFELDFDALTKSTGPLNSSASDPPVPSSKQVRSLFRNTGAPTASSSATVPATTTTTVSDDSKLLSHLFDATVTPKKRRSNKALLRATPEDDFLGVSFADTDGDYTTAEQFNEALLLLGPQPTSPEEQQNLPIDHTKSMDESTAAKQRSIENSVSPLSKDVTIDKTVLFPQDAGNMNAMILTEQVAVVELEQVESEPEDSAVLQTALVTVVLAQPKQCFTVETTISQSPNYYTSTLEASAVSDSVEEVATELIPENPLDRAAVAITEVLDSGAKASPECEVSVTVENVESIDLEPCPKLEKSCTTITTTAGSDSTNVTKGTDSDEEATLAMRLEPTELLNQDTQLASSNCNVDLVLTPEVTNKRFMSHDAQATKQLRTRSVSLTAPLELATSTPTRRSATNVPFSRQNRRRLFSAPSQVPTLPHARQTRNSLSRHPYTPKSDSISQPSGSSSNSTTVSHKLSSGGVDSTESKLISTQSSSTEQCSDLLIDNTNGEPMQTQSILTVLASSSALLEAAAVDLASDSDVSPIKSSFGQLETLDRMLRKCQRRSQQALDTSGSKSNVTTSSAESDATMASQADMGISTVPAFCTQLGASDEKLFVPISTLSTWSMASDPVCSSVPTTTPIFDDPQPTEPSTKSRPGRRKAVKRGKRTSAHRKPTGTNVTQPDRNPREIELPVVEVDQRESNITGLATTSFDSHGTITRSPSAASFTSALPKTGLLFCASERPHSFGLSSEAIAAGQTTYNPVPNGDFSQHVPRLNLAISGPLFPDLPPSPTDVTAHECDLCKASVCDQLQQRSSPWEQQKHTKNNSPQAPPTPVEQSVPDTVELQSTNTSVSDRVKHTSRKRRKRSHRSRSLVKATVSDTPRSDEIHVGFVQRNTFDSAIIVPIHLTKPPVSDAPFARFANCELLPTFADIQPGNVPVEGFGLKSSTQSSTWIPVTRPGPSLFEEQLKTLSYEAKAGTQSLSPNTSADLSSDMAEASSDRVSINSTVFHDEDKSNPVTCCCPSGPLSYSPRPQTVSTCSASFLPLLTQTVHVQPTINTSSFGLTSQLPTMGTSLQPPKTDTTSVSPTGSTPSALLIATGSSILGTGDPFHADGISSTTTPSFKLSNVPGFSPLSIPTTRIAGVTFGSFAGAAAFRATSFSALAAKAEGGQHKPGPGVFTKQLTFSDLAKAASQLDSNKPAIPIKSSSNHALWAEEKDQTSTTMFRLFLNNPHAKSTNDQLSTIPDAQTRSCDSPSSPKGDLSMGVSTSLSYSEDDSALSKVTTSDPSLSTPQSSIITNPENLLVHRVRRGSLKKRSRRKALRSAHKSKRRSQQLFVNGQDQGSVSLPATSSNSTTTPKSSPFILASGSLPPQTHTSACSLSHLTPDAVGPQSELVSKAVQDTSTEGLSTHSPVTHPSPNEMDEHKEFDHNSPVDDSQSCMSVGHNQLNTTEEAPLSQDEVILTSEHIDSNQSCGEHPSPSTTNQDVKPSIVSITHPESQTCSPSLNGTAESPVLVDEIITLPLDQNDCVALTQGQVLLVNSTGTTDEPLNDRTVAPANSLMETETGELDVHAIETGPDVAPLCEDPAALDNAGPETEQVALANGSVESTTEQNTAAAPDVSNCCPPIRLRLSLKSALHSYSTVSIKKSKRSKQHTSPPSQTMVAAPILTSHHNSSVTAVISSRTPTSLSIRLTPKPKVNRVPVVQPISLPQQPRSLSLEIQETPAGSKRARSRRRKRRVIRGRKSDQVNTISASDPSNPEISHTTASVAFTPGTNVGCAQSVAHSYAITSSSNTTRTAPVTRSSTVPCPTSRTTYPPRLASVFAKKIFSTAKQDRRSSYAHLSQPWRPGVRGSPRKRGLSRTQSVTLRKTVASAPNGPTSPMARRGRVAIRGRYAGGSLRGVRRLGKRTSSMESDLVRKRGGNVARASHPTEDPRAIRLVIRLGKHAQHPRSIDAARTSSASPIVTHSPNNDSHSEPEGVTLVRANVCPAQGDCFYASDVGDNSDPDVDHIDQDEEEEADLVQEVEESENVEEENDLNSTDELLPFEFCTATEAETYMDPNQVRIHRIVNQAVTTGVPVGDCFLGSDDEDEDDGIAESLLSASQTDRLVASATFTDHLNTKPSCLSQDSTYITNAPPPQMGYASISPRSSPSTGDRVRQKRKKRSERDKSSCKSSLVMVGKRRCSGSTASPLHSPVIVSTVSCQPQSIHSVSLESTKHHMTPGTDDPNSWNPQLLDVYGSPCRSDADTMMRRLEAASRLSDPTSYHGSIPATGSDVHTSVGEMLCQEAPDVPSNTKPFASLTQYPALSQTRSMTTVPSIGSYTSVHHVSTHPPTFGTGSGTGTSCGEGRSSSSTSSIVSVPALASVGSPGPENQSDFTVSSGQHRLAHLEEPVVPSSTSRDEYAPGLRGNSTNLLAISHPQSCVSPAVHCMDHRTTTADSLQNRSYGTSGQTIDGGASATSHISNSLQSVVSSTRLKQLPALSAPQSNDPTQPFSPIHEGETPDTAMHQQALAAVTAYAAAAAYAGLDRMMPTHQHVKAYYDQWASSLFGSLAANPAEFQPHSTSRPSDWSQAPTDRMSDTRQFDVSENNSASSSWIWNNQRPAHLPPSSTFETDSRTALMNGSSTYSTTVATGPHLGDFTTADNDSPGEPAPQHQTHHNNSVHTSSSGTGDSENYGAINRPMTIGSSYLDPQLPHLAAHPDPYRHFHPGLDYGRRFGSGPVNEPQVNGW